MAKRKRLSPLPVLGLDLSAAPETKADTAPVSLRRAPISDMAGADAATSAAREMADALTSARDNGRMVMDIPLDQIVVDYLVRDRVGFDAAEMDTLKRSLAARGQQVPIEVAGIGPNRYGLISGWRRLTALGALAKETSEARFATVQAILRHPAEAADAYLAMVEENEIRSGISYYERARIAWKATEQGVFANPQEALQHLYSSASRPRRSKIGSFMEIVNALDGALRHPNAVGERLGLRLSKALKEDPSLGDRLRVELETACHSDAEAELATIETALPAPLKPQSEPGGAASNSVAVPDPVRREPVPGVTVSTHSNGRLVIRGAQVDDTLAARLSDWLANTLKKEE